MAKNLVIFWFYYGQSALYKLKNKETVIVGDTENDILAGKAAGIKTVGVTYGWIGKDIKKANPDFVIDNIEELLKVLKLD